MIVENPYGNLPASQYGSLPFYTFMCFLYVISVVVWGMLCISYSKEVMSVQIIILIVIVSFVIDYSMKVLSLTVFNNTGNNSFILSLLSIAVDCTTRTLTRVLMLLVCMGLGVWPRHRQWLHVQSRHLQRCLLPGVSLGRLQRNVPLRQQRRRVRAAVRHVG